MSKPWPDLPLEAWRDTKDTLHLWTQIAGKVRLALAPEEPDWAHVTLYVTSSGLTTSPIPTHDDRTFEIVFDFVDHAVTIRVSDGSRRVLPLVPCACAVFYAQMLEALASLGIDVQINPRPQEIPGAIPFDEDEIHASYDPEWANRFFEVLRRVDMTMKEYRGRFTGRTTPVHFFWGTFDLAVTRYLGDNMLSGGFWAGDDRFPEPAFFAYTYPKPDGLESAAVRPPQAGWNEDLGEFILRYEDVRTAPSPHQALLDFLESAYEAGATRVKPMGQATPVPPSPQ
jgi:hypothetical protein